MEITREILELAALAIGEAVECTDAEFHGCENTSTVYTGVMLRGVQTAWRPHTDIADAVRLAVKRRMMVDVGPVSVRATGFCAGYEATVRHDSTERDMERAYCEAVTICAYRIGLRKREAK